MSLALQSAALHQGNPTAAAVAFEPPVEFPYIATYVGPALLNAEPLFSRDRPVWVLKWDFVHFAQWNDELAAYRSPSRAPVLVSNIAPTFWNDQDAEDQWDLDPQRHLAWLPVEYVPLLDEYTRILSGKMTRIIEETGPFLLRPFSRSAPQS